LEIPAVTVSGLKRGLGQAAMLREDRRELFAGTSNVDYSGGNPEWRIPVRSALPLDGFESSL